MQSPFASLSHVPERARLSMSMQEISGLGRSVNDTYGSHGKVGVEGRRSGDRRGRSGGESLRVG